MRSALYNLVRENFAMKLIALITAIVLWLYAAADRIPREPEHRLMRAEIEKVGTPSSDLIVKLRQQSLNVSISGPKAEVDGLSEGDIQAQVMLGGARPDTTRLKVRYKPLAAPGVRIEGPLEVPVEVTQKVRRAVSIKALFNDEPPAGTTFENPVIVPERAYVVGGQAAVDRVAQLVVFVQTGGSSVRETLPVRALDRDNVELTDVQIEPPDAHVEMALRQAPAARTMVVNPTVRGKPASPFVVAGVSAEPGEVVVTGKLEQLPTLANIPTEDVDITGITADTTREARLVLPPGVTVRNGPATVRVVVKVRDGTKTSS